MTTDQEEIAALKAQITEAEGRIAKLEARKKIPRPPPDEGTRVTELAPEVACALPDEKQLHELATIVFERYPELAPKPPHGAPRWQHQDVERRWHAGFSAAFTALASMRRLDRPDHRHYAHHWVDHAEAWLSRSMGRRPSACVGIEYLHWQAAERRRMAACLLHWRASATVCANAADGAAKPCQGDLWIALKGFFDD
jgi:hypothetical protein